MKVVVTGAFGFIGCELVTFLCERTPWQVTAIVRRPAVPAREGVSEVVVAGLEDARCDVQLETAFKGADAVVHLAAVTPDIARSKNLDLARLNADVTVRLAQIAASTGVRRFVYMSSALVFGSSSKGPLTEASPVRPADAYASTKLDGEGAVRAVALASMEWIIIRPPLVYGPGAKGALGTLVKAVIKGVPLPLKSATSNRRDLIGVRNLASFIALCLEHPDAGNEVFVVRDGEPLTTRALIEAIASAGGRPAVLLPVAPALLTGGARLLGAGKTMDRLLGSFEIDDAKARRLLRWQAPVPQTFDIERMVAAVRSGVGG